MTKYEKFEAWMVGKKVRYNGETGTVLREYESSTYYVWVLWEDQKALWIEVESLEFLEATPIEEAKSSIPWEVGQEVWCLFAGKGRVISVDEGNFDPVQVEFDDGGYMTYDYSGRKSGYDFRCLFFSEPVVIAERFPPKKPFVPKLKEGDVVVVFHVFSANWEVVTVLREDEDVLHFVHNNGQKDYCSKQHIAVKLLGEEVKWD